MDQASEAAPSEATDWADELERLASDQHERDLRGVERGRDQTRAIRRILARCANDDIALHCICRRLAFDNVAEISNAIERATKRARSTQLSHGRSSVACRYRREIARAIPNLHASLDEALELAGTTAETIEAINKQNEEVINKPPAAPDDRRSAIE